MSRPWMPLYVADYLADTTHLTAAEHGAYLLLIMHYWQTGGLPADDGKLARIARMPEREWLKSRETIAEFFAEGWTHSRIDRELSDARAAYERRAKAGRKGGETKAKKEQCSSNASTMLQQSQSQVSSLRSDTPRAEEADFRSDIGKVYARHGHLPPETGTAVVWLKQGRDPAVCLAVIDDHLARKRKKLPLAYFEGPIADAHAPPPIGEARAPPPSAKPAGNGWSEIFRKSHGFGEFADGRGS